MGGKIPEDEAIQEALDSMSGNIWAVVKIGSFNFCRPVPRGEKPEEWAARCGSELLFQGSEENAKGFLKDVGTVLDS